MEDASKVFFDMVNEYAGPLLNAAGYRITPQGFLEDGNGNKIFYQNPKYVDGTNDPQNPPFIFPVVPIDERSYLNIKATPEMELFNPFQNYKHACIVLVKLKKVLIPFYIDQNKLDETDEEEYDAKFDDCFQIYSKTNEAGLREIGIVDVQDPNNPKELMKYADKELTKAVWGLAVMIYNEFCSTKQLKQFKNIDRSWNKTQKLCDEWNKARIGILQQVKLEQENILNPDMVDYTNGMDDKSVEILPFPVDKFVDVGDCTDKNDPVLQNFLTSMFPSSQLTPYIEPEPDGGEELEVTPVVGNVVLPDTSMPTEEEMSFSNEEIEEGEEPIVEDTGAVVESEPTDMEAETSKAVLKAKMDEENEIEQETHKSVFSFKKPAQPTMTHLQQPMMGNGFGMNPMMGGMNPMMGGMGMNPMFGYNQQPLPASNIDDMNLCSTFVDPFAAYR